jgi:hypothetical protein
MTFTCTKDENRHESEAYIIGFDDRLCACCGGWWLKNGSDSARALFLPDRFENSIRKDEIPIKVMIRWERSGVPQCLNENIINIISICKE